MLKNQIRLVLRSGRRLFSQELVLKKQEEIQLKLEGETLFLRVSSEKEKITYEDRLRDLRRSKKYNQYQQCVRRVFSQIEHKKVKEEEVVPLLHCIIKTGYDFEYPAACASFEKLRRIYAASVLSSSLYAYMVLGAIRHRNTHELHQWLFETTVYGVQLDLNTFSQLGRAFRLSNSETAPRYWTQNMHYFLHYVNDIIQSEANSYRRTCQKTRFYLGIDPREFGYAIPAGQSGSLGGFGVRGAANASGKGGGPWRYYNPQEDRANPPQEAARSETEPVITKIGKKELDQIQTLSDDMPLQRLEESFKMDPRIREVQTSSTSEDQGDYKRGAGSQNYQPITRKQIHQFKDQLQRDHRELLAKGKAKKQDSHENKLTFKKEAENLRNSGSLEFYQEMLKTVQDYLKNQTNTWWQGKEDPTTFRNSPKSFSVEKLENPVQFQETFHIKYNPKKDSLRKLEEQELNKAMAQAQEEDFDEERVGENDDNPNEK